MKNGDKLIHSFSGSDIKNLGGLTKREYFAGLAMQGILSQFTELAANGASTEYYVGMQENVAKEAVHLADELLKQLENTK